MRLAAVCLALTTTALAACARPGRPPTAAPEAPVASADTAGLMLLYAPEGVLPGAPTVYELTVTPQAVGTMAVHRAGDLPAPGQTLRLDGLPADEAATLAGGLYKDRFHPSTRTHTCQGDAPVRLVAGETASIALTCIAVTDPTGTEPVKVFVKVARIAATLGTKDVAEILAARDFRQPALFSHQDESKRRISLQQTAQGLTLHVAGELGYFAAAEPGADMPLQQLLAGRTLTLQAISGRALAASPDDATLRLSDAPLLYEGPDGRLLAVLPVALANTGGTVTVAGSLFEEPAGHEFTIASYNVENLFDQIDEDRNASYGDYRILPNAQGVGSNYGVPVLLGEQTVSFTAVKIAGIRRALTAIDPAGPAIVGLVEIESRASLDALLAAMRDLGYQAAQFTEWPAGTKAPAIGQGVLSKFPITAWSLVAVATPSADAEPTRSILKVTLDVLGHPLLVYVNHWKSKSGPESQRKAYAEALERDLAAHLAVDPRTDFAIMGDLNSEYNEAVVLEAGHNDTGGLTGINTVLRAQGDELAVAKARTPLTKYNLHYELDRGERRSAWYAAHGWSGLDHIIIGAGLYDQRGVTYVDNSFQIPRLAMPRTRFLLNADGTTNRWRQVREGPKFTRHAVGGFSDHLPLFARLRVAARQSPAVIWLEGPGKPDLTDKP